MPTASAPDYVFRTQRALAPLVPTPPAAAALERPSFELLHGVLCEVMRATAFGEGAFTAEEECGGDALLPEDRQVFLSKAVGLVGASLGSPVRLRVSSALAGDDPEATNHFLQRLAEAASQKLAAATSAPAPASERVPLASARVSERKENAPTTVPPTKRTVGSAKRAAAPASASGVRSGSCGVRGGGAAASDEPTRRPAAARATVPAPAPATPATPPSSSSSRACVHCGYESDEELPYCKLCGKVRHARAGRGNDDAVPIQSGVGAWWAAAAPTAAAPPARRASSSSSSSSSSSAATARAGSSASSSSASSRGGGGGGGGGCGTRRGSASSSSASSASSRPSSARGGFNAPTRASARREAEWSAARAPPDLSGVRGETRGGEAPSAGGGAAGRGGGGGGGSARDSGRRSSSEAPPESGGDGGNQSDGEGGGGSGGGGGAGGGGSDADDDGYDWYAEQLRARWAQYQQGQASRDEAAAREAAAAEEAEQRRRDGESARRRQSSSYGGGGGGGGAGARSGGGSARAGGGAGGGAAAAAAARARAEAQEARWDAFAARAKLGGAAPIGEADVPWPPAELDAASFGLDARVFDERERKQAYRAASLRWHPDKFVQAYGGLLRDDERDAVLARVTRVSQAVNALVQEVPL